MKWLEHLKTITAHKIMVMRHCFAVGLYKQGLLHDLSKYSWTEFSMGAKYYQGNRSPNDAEREDKGYTSSWLHHKGRNKHHLEYWVDYNVDRSDTKHLLVGCKMPKEYVIEMFCDRVAASKTYRGSAYRDSDPYDYYMRSVGHYMIHPNTAALLLDMLTVLKDQGEDAAFRHIKEDILKHGKQPEYK